MLRSEGGRGCWACMFRGGPRRGTAWLKARACRERERGARVCRLRPSGRRRRCAMAVCGMAGLLDGAVRREVVVVRLRGRWGELFLEAR